MKYSKKNRDLLRKDPEAFQVKKVIMLYASSIFRKKMTLGRMKQMRNALSMLSQRERRIARKYGWDRGFLRENEKGELHPI